MIVAVPYERNDIDPTVVKENKELGRVTGQRRANDGGTECERIQTCPALSKISIVQQQHFKNLEA
jgi:hypothetical protein